jgi:hypothetical protein
MYNITTYLAKSHVELLLDIMSKNKVGASKKGDQISVPEQDMSKEEMAERVKQQILVTDKAVVDFMIIINKWDDSTYLMWSIDENDREKCMQILAEFQESTLSFARKVSVTQSAIEEVVRAIDRILPMVDKGDEGNVWAGFKAQAKKTRKYWDTGLTRLNGLVEAAENIQAKWESTPVPESGASLNCDDVRMPADWKPRESEILATMQRIYSIYQVINETGLAQQDVYDSFLYEYIPGWTQLKNEFFYLINRFLR